MKLGWIVHGTPHGHMTNATNQDPETHQRYVKLFYNPSITGTPKTWHKRQLANSANAYTICRGAPKNGTLMDMNHRRGGYAGVTVFVYDAKITNEQEFFKHLDKWFEDNIINPFVIQGNQGRTLQWNPEKAPALFSNKYDNSLSNTLLTNIKPYLIDTRPTPPPPTRADSMRNAKKQLESKIAKLEAELTMARKQLAEMQQK